MHGPEKVNWFDENKILIPDQKITSRVHRFQLLRERTSGNYPRTHFLLYRMATPWTTLPKNIVHAHSVTSFKIKLDVYLNEVGRNTHIYS